MAMIDQILHLPSKFYENNSEESFTKLLLNTGYYDKNYAIEIKDIYKKLCEHPDYIKEWMNWSENKRVKSGWFIEKKDNKYAVGFINNGIDDIDKLKIFNELANGCAYFIFKEIEYVRMQHSCK